MAFKKKVVEEPVKRDMGKAILELVNKMVEEKKVSSDVIFNGIEAAIQLAAERHFQVEEGVVVHIDRATGDISAKHGDKVIDPETLGRIAAQSAKQVMIQKIREAESDTVFNEYATKKGELIQGSVQRVDAGTAIVSLGKSEAIIAKCHLSLNGTERHRVPGALEFFDFAEWRDLGPRRDRVGLFGAGTGDFLGVIFADILTTLTRW